MFYPSLYTSSFSHWGILSGINDHCQEVNYTCDQIFSIYDINSQANHQIIKIDAFKFSLAMSSQDDKSFIHLISLLESDFYLFWVAIKSFWSSSFSLDRDSSLDLKF